MLICLRQGPVLPQSVQGRHKRVALFSPFTLVDGVACSLGVPPNVRGRLTVRQTHKGEHGTSARELLKLAEHGASVDVVESSDAVNRDHGESRIDVRACPEGMSHAVRTCSRGQGVLEGGAGAFDFLAELLRQCSAYMASDDVTCDYPPDLSVVLAQSSQASHRERIVNAWWDVALGVLFSDGAVEV